MDLSRLDPRLDLERKRCRAVIESPKGGRAKFAYDPQSRAFELKRLLPDGLSFPLDFGFVPGTLGQDGDPVDILVLNDEPTPTGTLLEARLIGVIEADQTEKGKTLRNDRILAVAEVSHLFERIAAIGDLGDAFLKNLTQFWITYNRLRGSRFEVLGVKGAARAAELIQQGLAP